MDAAKQSSRTLDELLDRFEREVLPNRAKRTRSDYVRHIKVLRQAFGPRTAGQITRADIEDFLRVPEGAKGGIHRNRIVAVLSSVFGRALQWNWVSHNPCSNVRRNPSKTEERNLSEEEFEGVRKLALPRIRVAMDLAMLTRQSQGNLLTLRWDQVQEHTIIFRDPRVRKKGRQKIEVEITPEIRRVLAECRELSRNSEYVISESKSGGRYTNEGFRSNWQRLMKKWERTGNDRFTFHHIKATAERLFAERQARKAELNSAVADYPQFEPSLRAEAASMAEYYQVFYCLEQKIRRVIVRHLTDVAGAQWWDSPRVPTDTKNNAEKLRQREVESGITPRSENMIDYTSFGELSGIITSNWDIFHLAFHNKAAISRVLHALNLLRGPIAHSCLMTPDEIHRLGIWVKDWFRQLK